MEKRVNKLNWILSGSSTRKKGHGNHVSGYNSSAGGGPGGGGPVKKKGGGGKGGSGFSFS